MYYSVDVYPYETQDCDLEGYSSFLTVHFLCHAEAHAKEDRPLGSCRGARGSRGKAAKTEGLKSGQSDHCSGSPEEMAAVNGRFHEDS